MNATLFEIKDIDNEFYNTSIKDFVPDNIIDIHSHVYYKRFLTSNKESTNVTWPSLVARENPIGDLLKTYELLFPGKNVTPLIFGNLLNKRDNFNDGNNYIKKCARENDIPALYFARPHESATTIKQKLTNEGFKGLKVYLSLSDKRIPVNKITIFDFLPHHQLEVINELQALVILHIPRPGRLADTENLKQMIEIEKRYPNIKLIIAHVGRAYCKEDIGNAFDVLSSTQNMLFDFSANTNNDVFYDLINTVGPKRILFGSDLPITRMRMKRICQNGRYINIVPPGIYGDISADPNMQEAQAGENEKLTFFLYEEIAAFKRAAEKANLTKSDIDDIFFNNAKRIL